MCNLTKVRDTLHVLWDTLTFTKEMIKVVGPVCLSPEEGVTPTGMPSSLCHLQTSCITIPYFITPERHLMFIKEI